MHKQVVIIGAGPAGIACAIQLKRYGIDSVIIEKDKIGGLLREANIIENFLGSASGISSSKLISIFQEKLKKSKIKITKQEVLDVQYLEDKFQIKTNKTQMSSEYLVVASGTTSNKIDTGNNNINYSVKNLLKLKNKSIAIIGAGDAAFDYAINLSRHNKVSILNRSDKPKCLPLLFQQAKKRKNIKYLINVDIEKEINTNKKYNKILAAIGRTPALSFIKEIQDNNSKIFYIGDVKNDIYRQCSIAIGDGIKIAMRISEQLTANREQQL